MKESQTSPLTGDERRLVAFFRSLAPADQSKLLIAAGEKAVSRCFPTKDLVHFMPAAEGVDPEAVARGDGIEVGSGNGLTIAEIISDGCFQNDISSQLLGSEHFDDPEIEAEKLRATIQAFKEQDLYDFYPYNAAFRSHVITSFIREWRERIASACQGVANAMAKTVGEAENQNIPVPESEDDWIQYALTLDGERIADEVDWPAPGDFDTDLTSTMDSLDEEAEDLWPSGPPRVSPTLTLRLALYEKLRFLQARNLLPPTTEQMEEIKLVLRWLRYRG